jgi:hypothetical protein
VAAVAEAATGGEPGDVLEGGVETLLGVPELELADPRVVDQQGAVGQPDQLAVGGGVAPAVVPLAHLGGRHHRLAVQRVDQGRLAGARRADQGDGGARLEVLAELLQPLAALGRGDVDRNVAGDPLDLGDLGLEVGGEVGLVEHDHRLGAALPRGDQEALEPARVVVAVHAHHHEHPVEVGGHHLGLGALARHFAQEARGAVEHRHDVGELAAPLRALDEHPVADRGQLVRALGAVAQRPLGPRLELALRSDQQAHPAVLADDAPGDQVLVAGQQLVELLREERGEAPGTERALPRGLALEGVWRVVGWHVVTLTQGSGRHNQSGSALQLRCLVGSNGGSGMLREHSH